MKIPKPLKAAWDIFTTVVVAVVVIFAVLLVGVRLFDIQVYSVISGSMEPEYPVGSLIYVKDVDPWEVEVGDVITYVLPNDMPSTHRVVRIDEANQHFYTKGDANNVEDTAPVHFKNLIGKPVFTIPLLGYIAYYIQHPPGMYIAIAVGALILLLAFLPDLFKKSDKNNPSEDASTASENPAPSDDNADTAINTINEESSNEDAKNDATASADDSVETDRE